MAVWEQLAALAALGQLAILGVGALFAFRQLDALRRQREAELIAQTFATLNADDFATALQFVYTDLATRLTDPAYVREILDGKATAASHRELAVMHFFNELGLLVHSKMVGEYPIVAVVASPCMRAWEQLAPVVELMRRRYPHAYTPFESLVVRSRALDLSAINTRFQSETPGLRAQWESTSRDLRDRRITLPDHFKSSGDLSA
ncbi:MAG: hypothetical protein WAK16_11705 [Candidatus Cybelea sp.]